jgi:hypothetical protein
MEANTRLFSDVKNDSGSDSGMQALYFNCDRPRRTTKEEKNRRLPCIFFSNRLDSQTDTSQIVTPSNNTTSEVKVRSQ